MLVNKVRLSLNIIDIQCFIKFCTVTYCWSYCLLEKAGDVTLTSGSSLGLTRSSLVLLVFILKDKSSNFLYFLIID